MHKERRITIAGQLDELTAVTSEMRIKSLTDLINPIPVKELDPDRQLIELLGYRFTKKGINGSEIPDQELDQTEADILHNALMSASLPRVYEQIIPELGSGPVTIDEAMELISWDLNAEKVDGLDLDHGYGKLLRKLLSEYVYPDE